MADTKGNNKLRSLFNGSIDLIAIFDMNNHVIDLNPAFERLFGYTKKEMLGMPFPGHLGYDEGIYSKWIE
jgi:PAS domain S-box-containing protein